MATSMDQRHDNDLWGLEWIYRFVWLRSLELGRLMWPDDTYARTRTDRVIRGWRARGLVIERQLPNGAGRAITLAEAGARLLRDEKNIDVRSGKDWGETKDGKWVPKHSWQHDLIAAGVLTLLYEKDYDILPEPMLHRENPGLQKFPDGLVYKDDLVVWLEIEQARKTGPHMQNLATALYAAATGQAPQISGKRVTTALLTYVEGANDERGYRLDHHHRVIKALRKTASKCFELHMGKCTLAGCGVADLEIDLLTIEPEFALRILGVLEADGWRQSAEGGWEAQYGDLKACIWEAEHMGWAAQLCRGEKWLDCPRQAANKTAAKMACASWIAELHPPRTTG